MSLSGDREIASDVREERPIGTGEVTGIAGEPLDRLLAGGEHGAAVLELALLVRVGVDEILDRPIDGPRVLIHDAEDPLVHGHPDYEVGLADKPWKSPVPQIMNRGARAIVARFWRCYKVVTLRRRYGAIRRGYAPANPAA
jgi:hypothetical protein